MKCFLCTVHYVFFTVIMGSHIILMSPREYKSQKSQYDWHDFQPWWWGLAMKWGLGFSWLLTHGVVLSQGD